MFAEQEGIEYPLLSDFWPHGEVSRAYGVFLESHGISTRGTFVIDKEGVIRWSVVNGPGEIRDADELVPRSQHWPCPSPDDAHRSRRAGSVNRV